LAERDLSGCGTRPPASTLRLPPGPWATVLDCLSARFTAVPREQWASRMTRGLVCDGAGRPLDIMTPHRAGLEVRYYRELARETHVPALESIVYADDRLVVADKPHFLPVAPAGDWVEQTLLVRLMRRLGNRELVPLHRIDRATAGLVLFSADPGSRATYQALFRERRIRKIYEALAPPLPDGVFPLVRRTRLEAGEPFFRMRETDGVANSESRITVLDRGREFWRYELMPVTGRKHQLRVHMAALGVPIANDPYYPELKPRVPDHHGRPLALLARLLEFVDPLSGAPRRFASQLRLLDP
jgi:tRNA pseudouridine32 synthase / 23S rRNA pseudouridine746 synthase